ncbi:MAG: hypothetical protein HN929_00005, partial [Chloroflexi bacterium]|nr:hypothetical protein [Chloroflexota bacterium]
GKDSEFVDVNDDGNIDTVYTLDGYIDALNHNTESLSLTDTTPHYDIKVGEFKYDTDWENIFHQAEDDDFICDGDCDGQMPTFAWYESADKQDIIKKVNDTFADEDDAPETADYDVSGISTEYSKYRVQATYEEWDCTWGVCWSDEHYLDVEGMKNGSEDITETQNDYEYHWTSEISEIRDTRRQLNYEWVSQVEDVWDFRNIYEERNFKREEIAYRQETIWETRVLTDTETRLVSELTFDAVDKIGGNFAGDSLQADTGALFIQAGNNVNLTGNIRAGQQAEIKAGSTLNIEGYLPEGAEVPAIAEINAVQGIDLIAGSNLNIADSAKVEVSGTGADLSFKSGQTMTLGGELIATGQGAFWAGSNINLSGKITAPELIDIQAGNAELGGAQDGAVSADSETLLRAKGTSGQISISAGEYGGDIRLDKSSLEATSQVSLKAPSSKIISDNTDGSNNHGLINTNTLKAEAETGFTAYTDISFADIVLTDTGDIKLNNTGALELTKSLAADGKIIVENLGAVTVGQVATLGISDRNDIILKTFKIDGQSADLDINTLSAGGRGDITLGIHGVIRQTSGVTSGDNLTVLTNGAVTALTAINSLNLQTNSAGNVHLTQKENLVGNKLTLDFVKVLDGKFELVSLDSDGAVDIADVKLGTAREANDIIITAQKDILVRRVQAGIPKSKDTVINTPGDIFLTSKQGSISESYTDQEVDIIADEASFVAKTGITDLEVSLNRLAKAKSDSGDISIFESDSGTGKGLNIGLVETGKNIGSTVEIQTDNLLYVGSDSTVRGDTIRLTSKQASVQVDTPTSGSGLDYTAGIAFNAADVLRLYQFFNAPELIEYRTGSSFLFGTGAANWSTCLPSDLEADSIIIETTTTISINGTLTASKLIELISDTNVLISGDILAKDGQSIDEVKVTAKGTKEVTYGVDVNNAGKDAFSAESQASGYIDINTQGIDAGDFELRAKNEIVVLLEEDFVLSGFVGGLENFDPSGFVKLQTKGALIVEGGIVAAQETLDIKARDVRTDDASTFIAKDILARARQGIRANTLAETIDARSDIIGDIIINEADEITLKNVVANNGAVKISAGDTMKVRKVQTIQDGASNFFEAAAADGTKTLTVSGQGITQTTVGDKAKDPEYEYTFNPGGGDITFKAKDTKGSLSTLIIDVVRDAVNSTSAAFNGESALTVHVKSDGSSTGAAIAQAINAISDQFYDASAASGSTTVAPATENLTQTTQGSSSQAAKYEFTLAGQTITFMASSNETETGNGSTFNNYLTEVEVIGAAGDTIFADYNGNNTITVYVKADGTTTVKEAIDAINALPNVFEATITGDENATISASGLDVTQTTKGTANAVAAVYSFELAADTIEFKASANGTETADGSTFNDLSIEITANNESGVTASYDSSTSTITVDVQSNAQSTSQEVADAIAAISSSFFAASSTGTAAISAAINPTLNQSQKGTNGPTAAAYSFELAGDTMTFQVSSNGTATGDGSSFNDMTVYVIDDAIRPSPQYLAQAKTMIVHAKINGGCTTEDVTNGIESINSKDSTEGNEYFFNVSSTGASTVTHEGVAVTQTQDGASPQPAEYEFSLAGDTISFKVSDNGTGTGDGINFNDLKVEVVADSVRKTKASYNGQDTLTVHVLADGSSTTSNVAQAINIGSGNFFGAEASNGTAKVTSTGQSMSGAQTAGQSKAAAYEFDLAGDTISFQASNNGEGTGDGSMYNDISVYVLGDALEAVSADYNGKGSITVHVLADGSSTSAEVAA